MIGMASPLISRLLSNAADWLQNPYVRVFVDAGDEVVALRLEIEKLQSQVATLMLENQRLAAKYSQEVALNLSYEDLMRSRGIKFRR